MSAIPLPPAPPQGRPRLCHEDSLRRHLRQCNRLLGRGFGAIQWAERVHMWCAPRLVTTVALASVALAASLSWL